MPATPKAGFIGLTVGFSAQVAERGMTFIMQSRRQKLGAASQLSFPVAGRLPGSNSESLDLCIRIRTTHQGFVVQYRLTPAIIATRYLRRCGSMYNCKLDPVVLWTVKYAYRC